MNAEELQAFLDRPLLGVVGTLRRDGSPHVVPVWYRWDGDVVLIWSDEERTWVRHLQRDPRVAFSVQEIEPPFAAAVMHGRAEFRRGEDEAIGAEIRRIAARYLPAAEVEPYLGQWEHLQGLVTIRPETINAWSQGY